MGELLEQLNRLSPQQMNDLLTLLQVPNHLSPPPTAIPGDRVHALIGWVQSPGGPGIERLAEELERIGRTPGHSEREDGGTAPNTTTVREGTPFNTHALDQIRGYLVAHAPRKSRAAHQESAERLVFAAWRWLRPESTLERLEKIQEDAGLVEMEPGLFVRKLCETCADIEEDHPRLRPWVLRRCALLEYRISTLAELTADLSTTGTSLNYSLFTGLMDYCDSASPLSREQALNAVGRVSAETLTQAMVAVGQIVCRTLSTQPGDCEFQANLMLPVGPEFLDSALFSSARPQKNMADAGALWGEREKYNRCLAVVAETDDVPEYLGFWIPLLLTGRNPSAGAATAYYKARASAVFIDDLPPLGDDVPQDSYSRWTEYLSQRFQQAVFVSLPFAIEVRRGQKRVPAIINVNVNPARDGDFRRAYHPEWLRIAQQAAAPLVCEAHKAFVLSRASFR